VAVNGPEEAARRDPAIAMGINTVAGRVTNEPVADFLGVEYVEPLAAFAG
jgi:alanine dehydrogenase